MLGACMTSRIPPQPNQLPTEDQQRMHGLLDKNSEGTITPDERAELEGLVEASERLMVNNARRLAEFTQKFSGAPATAVPVTIWVKPEHAEP